MIHVGHKRNCFKSKVIPSRNTGRPVENCDWFARKSIRLQSNSSLVIFTILFQVGEGKTCTKGPWAPTLDRVHGPLSGISQIVPPSWNYRMYILRHFGNLTAITEDETYSIIMNLAKKSCALDPIPTPPLVKCIDVLLLVITKMVNISLERGHFLSAWKEALVRPNLKKNGLDRVFKNYRPVSNLSFTPNKTERAVFLQIDNHMKKHA